MLQEPERRRPEWREGVPIRLADGRDWHFPKPRLQFHPHLDGGKVTLAAAFTFGPAFDELLNSLRDADDTPTRLVVMFTIAVDLLGRNYDLTAQDYAALLRIDLDDEESIDVWHQIIDVAVGNAPKPTTVGESSPSSPTV